MLAPWMKNYDQPREHIKKQKADITLLIDVHIVKAVVFLIVMYGCESWNIKKAEHLRVDTFKLWCWRRLWRVPWSARRSNQSAFSGPSVGRGLETSRQIVDTLKIPVISREPTILFFHV